MLLSLHLLAAIVWIGSSVMVEVMVSRARAAGNGAHLTGVLEDWAWMGSRVFPAAAVVMLVTGLLMVADVEGYEIGDPWISVGMGVLVVLILLGAGYTGPRAAKLVGSMKAMGTRQAPRRRRSRECGRPRESSSGCSRSW